MTNANQMEDWSARNPMTRITRSPSPRNTFPGNRLPGSSGATSAPAPAQAATQSAPELSGQHPLILDMPASNVGAGRAAIASSVVEPGTQQPTVAVTAPAASNPMTDWNRSGMSNAQVAEANPAGRVTMTRQANGTMAFSGGDVSGPVSYMDGGGNPLAGGGVRGNGFNRVDSAPAGSNVLMGPNGSFAYASGNPIANAAGQPSPASTVSSAASGAVDTALAAAMQRGDFDAVRAHYAGRSQAQGTQGVHSLLQGFTAEIGQSGNAWGRTPEQQRRDAETQASSIHKQTAANGVAALSKLDAQELAAARNQSDMAKEQMRISGELAREAMRQDGENLRSADSNRLASLEQGRASAYQAAQLDFSQQRLDLERERAGRDGLPQGYRRTADGQGLEPIRGGPADPLGKTTLNDVQSKSLQFGARMLQSGQALDQLAGQGVTQPGYIKRSADLVGAGALANWTQSPQQQQVEQSQRDYVNAVLRRESGAAISNAEFDNARKQYFPQPGDSAQVIEQKRRNRELATHGVLAEVPNQQSRVQQVLGAAGQAGGQSAQRIVVRTGTANGRKVLQFNDGSIGYAD